MAAKNTLLNLLRREALTITEMGERLGVTRNAIIVQLKQLEAAGLVVASPAAKSSGAGKPALQYQATPGSEDMDSKGYPFFLSSLVDVLRRELDETALEAILDKTGREMAIKAGIDANLSFEEKLQAAMQAADSVGASTERVNLENGIMIRNYTCPLGTAVRKEACVCRSLAAFFAQATGETVTEQCMRDNQLICQYVVEKPA